MDQYIKQAERSLDSIRSAQQLSGILPATINRIDVQIYRGAHTTSLTLPLSLESHGAANEPEEVPEIRKLLEALRNLLAKQVITQMATVRDEANNLLPEPLKLCPQATGTK